MNYGTSLPINTMWHFKKIYKYIRKRYFKNVIGKKKLQCVVCSVN